MNRRNTSRPNRSAHPTNEHHEHEGAVMIRVIKLAVMFYVLEPLIARDFHLRAAGKCPDEWHWADRLAWRWGVVPEYPKP